MCGIIGIRAHGASTFDRRKLEQMTDMLAHRGPDGHGVWATPDATVGLGHRRLAIIDRSALGSQPMVSASGRFVISFNGEIYNFISLRTELAKCGARFRGESDTEVMLAAIETWGFTSALQRAAGMFAMGVWDEEDRVLYLARDRIGIKPLYYASSGAGTAFASEIRPLVHWLGKLPPLSKRGLQEYLRLGYVPAPLTIFENVAKLPPATILRVTADGAQAPEVYWSLLANTCAASIERSHDEPSLRAQLEEMLDRSVREHMIADVPLGAFLSGGIDSSTVVALMQRSSTRPVRTFTIGFGEAGFDESKHAAAVARQLGTDHTELTVTDAEARDLIPIVPSVYDEPFADASQLPTMAVSRLARTQVTVALSGDGGDELFAGYDRYPFVAEMWRRIGRTPAMLRRPAAGFLRTLPAERWNALFRCFGRVLPSGCIPVLAGQKIYKGAALLGAESVEALSRAMVAQWAVPELMLGPRMRPEETARDVDCNAGLDTIDRQILWDMANYLPDDILTKVDRASMHYGLEARVPLLDHRIIEFALGLPITMKIREGTGKWLLRQVLYRHVPQEVVDRPKMGFNVPIAAWLRGPLRPWAQSLLDAKRIRQEGLLDEHTVAQTWHAHLTGAVDRGSSLWTLLMLQAWWDRAKTWA